MAIVVADNLIDKKEKNEEIKIKKTVEKVRKVWVDKLRLISMMAVILIHIAGNTLETFGLSGTAATVFLCVKHVCFFSIGIFIMISGAMFLNRDISIKDMFKKYILKIFIALVVFGAAYSAIEIVFIEKSFSLKSISQILLNIVNGNLWAHMWYLYLVLGIYVLTPAIRVFTKNCSEAILKYTILALFIVTFIVPDLSYIFNINIAFTIEISAFLVYYLYGHFITNYKVSKKYVYISYALGVASLVAIVCLVVCNKYMGLVRYASSLVFFSVNAIFLFIKNRKDKERKINGLITSIDKCSFGIYLIHQFFINVIYKLLKFDVILKVPYIGLVTYSVAIATISYVAVYILKKIKIINKYLL